MATSTLAVIGVSSDGLAQGYGDVAHTSDAYIEGFVSGRLERRSQDRISRIVRIEAGRGGAHGGDHGLGNLPPSLADRRGHPSDTVL